MTIVEDERVNKVDRKRIKEDKQMTKVVVRHLPPSMTLESFLDQVDVPPHDYICYAAADKTLMPQCTSRVYINFLHVEDLLIFTQKFDGYVFLDNKGHEFQAVVEFAPFQRIAKSRSTSNKKRNAKCGTIESDPYFIEFKKNLQEEREKAGSCSFKQHYFETNTENGEKNKITDTPLLQYLRNKIVEKAKTRDEKREERKRKEAERKKLKEEQQILRRTKTRKVEQEAHSNSIYTEGPYENKRDVFSRRKQDQRRKSGRDKDTPKNQTSKSKLTLKGTIAQSEKSVNFQDSKDTKRNLLSKEETLAPVVSTFQDPAIIEMRLASGSSKPKSRYTKQESNSQQDKRQKLKEENKKNKSIDTKFNKIKEKINSRDGRNRDKGDRFARNKLPQENDYRDKTKQGEEIKCNGDKSCDEVKKSYIPSFSKTKSSPIKYNSIDEKKIALNNSENLVEKISIRTDKSNKVTNKIDPKSSAKSNNVTINVDAKVLDRFSKARDRVDRSNKVGSPCKQFDKLSSKVTESLKSENENSNGKTSHCKNEIETSEQISKLELGHNILQRRKSLEGKQMEKYVESGRRNSLDSGKKNDDDEDCRDPRTERRIRNKDRPSIAIYRPGMGRFSKQRFGNDMTGSSTEQDSHSPSPTNMSKVAC